MMRALRFDRIGDLAHLVLADVPRAVVAPGEARVSVRAAGLHPSDPKNVLGAFPYTTLPRTPGRDFAGVVTEGPESWLSREVWGCGKEFGFTRDGSHADEIVVPIDGLAHKPRALSFAQAASAGVTYVTAWDALERTALSVAETLLVIGAAGSVGRAALDIGRLRGARVLGAVRNPSQLSAIEAASATPLLLPADRDLGPVLARFAANGVDVVFDCTGAWFDSAVHALGMGGRLAFIAAPAGGRVEFDALRLYRRGGTVVGVNSLLHDARSGAEILNRIGAAFEHSLLPLPPSPDEIPLRDGVAAYRAIAGGAAARGVFVP